MKRKAFKIYLAAVTTGILCTGFFHQAVWADSADLAMQNRSHLNEKWLENLRSYYQEQLPVDLFPDEVFCINTFADTYRGEFSWCLYNDYFDLDYYTQEDDELSISIDVVTGEIELSVDLAYDDGCSYDLSCEEVAYNEIGRLLADLSTAEFESLYDDRALEEHDVQNDILIMYARFLQLSQRAMEAVPEAGSLSGYGLILDPVEDVDPSTPLSKEVAYLVNEHIFENCQCKDCQMTWPEYLQQAFGILMQLDEDETWHVYNGIRNESKLQGDQVHFYNQAGHISAEYNSILIKADRRGNIWQNFNIQFVGPQKLQILHSYEDIFVVSGINDDQYESTARAKCKLTMEMTPDQLDDVLSSKTALMEAATFEIYSYCPGGDEYIYFDNWAEEDINSYLQEQNYTMITKEELCEKLSTEYNIYVLSIDKCLREAGTSLIDCGIEIDQIME